MSPPPMPSIIPDWGWSQGMQNPYHWMFWEKWAPITEASAAPDSRDPVHASSSELMILTGEECWSGAEALWRLWRHRPSNCSLPSRFLRELMPTRLWELQCPLMGSQWRKQKQRRQHSLLQEEKALMEPKSMLRALRLQAARALHQQRLKWLLPR